MTKAQHLYEVRFLFQQGYTEHTIKAATLKDALRKARAMAAGEEAESDLAADAQPYDDVGDLEEIQIEGDEGSLEWATPFQRLQDAAPQLLEAIGKLLRHAEAEQERLYKRTLKYPGRGQSAYEDCRHAVSFAYEAVAKAGTGAQ